MHTSLALLIPAAATALQRTAGSAPRSVAGGAPDLTWLMAVAAVLVVVIGCVAYGFKRLVAGSIKARASRRELAVLDVLPLGGKRQLAGVRCFDRTFALGLGERDVSLVAELDHDAVAKDRAEREPGDPFKSRLEAARAQLLAVRDLVPAPRRSSARPAPPTTPIEVESSRPGTEKEYIA